MKLTVAANYDPELIPLLAPYPVDEIFGKFPVDFVGGGRPTYMAEPLSRKELCGYVSLLNKSGIAFNYLFNSPCLANREWTSSWQRKLMSLLDRLGSMGITRLTVSTPFLLELIKKRFPQFYVKVGIYAQIDTVTRARFWQDLGADALTLESFSINRDFARLSAIRSAVKCDLQLIANHCCLPNCPLQYYHQNGIAHSSDGSKGLFIDYCFLRCSRLRLDDPSLLIKSAWIRPEDIGFYENMGFTTFKILERGIPSAELLKRIKAYSDRRFEGNLAELIFYHAFTKPAKKQKLRLFRHFLKPFQFKMRYAPKFLALLKGQGMLFPISKNPYTIDSARIPADFLEFFKTSDCSMTNCNTCGYCEDIAHKAVTIDPAFRAESLRQYAEIENLMSAGGLWGV